jgi:two-component system OmpR family sensor kinase
LPAIDVSAAAYELCLSNLLANAIKYSDPAKEKRWVEVRARLTAPDDGGAPETVVEVRDNGLGVPEQKRAQLFKRFFRAHEDITGEIDGTGLGLSIVRETAASFGGKAWAEFHEDGTAFYFTMPTRRAEDVAAKASPRVAESRASVSDDRTERDSAR